MDNQNDQQNITPDTGIPPVQQNQSGQSIKSLLKNKYMMAIIAAIILLLAIIFSIVFMNTNSASNSTTAPSPTPANQSVYPTSSNSNPATSQTPSSADLPIITPEPTQAALIENQTQPQIQQDIAVPYTVTNITQFGDNWATMNITNPDVGGAGVIIQKVNGAWKVVLGPGSIMPPDQLQSIGAPQELIDSLEPKVSPSPAQ